jgi:glyoxylase-like metal-dependent hydrolase (beta-lactamase superfamily II)
MRAFFGETLPVPEDRLCALADGDIVAMGDRSLAVVHTPGHASHHIALHESLTGAMFTGEAIGSHLPWVDCYRPALPPPEVDVERALESIEQIRARRATTLLTSHFGAIADADEGCERGAQRIRDWSDTVRRNLEADPGLGLDHLTEILREQAAREHLDDSGVPIELTRYDVLGSVAMNAAGLARYWKKRWERDAALDPTDPPSTA